MWKDITKNEDKSGFDLDWNRSKSGDDHFEVPEELFDCPSPGKRFSFIRLLPNHLLEEVRLNELNEFKSPTLVLRPHPQPS